MKMTLAIILAFCCGAVFCQTRSADFSYIDRHIKSIKGTDPAILSSKLTSGYSKDIEKVRAIFRWITENIAYYKTPEPTRRRQRKMASNAFTSLDPSDTMALKPLTDRVAEKVLIDRKAVCEGYARLFKSLCDHAGIRSEIITGYARTGGYSRQSLFRSNHSWNAVMIDSTWHLLDVTWASGVTIFPTGEFMKYYDDYYFLTPPENFIRHHFPDDLRWALLDDLPHLNEFKFTPFLQRSFVKYPIVDFFPIAGILEATIGDTLRLELMTGSSDREWDIAPDSLWSEMDLSNPRFAFVQPDPDSKGRKLFYHYPVVSENVHWIHVMYNNDAVLRYRLKVKKELAKETNSVPD